MLDVFINAHLSSTLEDITKEADMHYSMLLRNMSLEWVRLAEDRIQWYALMNTRINHRIS
jgi:hypothetical protein